MRPFHTTRQSSSRRIISLAVSNSLNYLLERLEGRVLLSNTIYVDAGAGGVNTGANWTDAYASLAVALGAATAGTEVCVAGGTYKPTAGIDRNISFQLTSGVDLEGGYAGCNGPNPDVRDVAAYPTVLSGDIGVAGDNSDNSYHVVVTNGVDATTVLDGLTITAGNANGGQFSPQTWGAGLYNDSGSPTLNNCMFFDNGVAAYGKGAGMYNLNSVATLTNCTFLENWSPTYTDGLGVYAEASSLTLSGCSFIRNHLLPDHQREAQGGGVFTRSSSVNMTDCTFFGNETGIGGALRIYADWPAGLPQSTVTNCLFVANLGTFEGGAVISSGLVAITNFAFICNSAIEVPIGRVGAVIAYAGSSVSNSIVWDNPAPDGTQIQADTAQYCDVQGGYAGTGNIDADPQFVRYPSPGPDNLWRTSDDDYGDLRPAPSSPLIDAGSNAAVPAGVLTDIRGFARIFDYPGVHDPGAIVDMGAYERGLNVSILGTPGADIVTTSAAGFTLNGVTNSDAEAVTFDGAGGWDTVSLNGGPSVTFSATQHFQSLTIYAGTSAFVAAGSNSALVTRNLAIAPTGLLDLADNDLILDYADSPQLPAVQALINSAHTGGTWTGFGITSSTARLNAQHNTTLGAMESEDYLAMHAPATVFDDEPIDSSAVLVKYTYYGDADFSGAVEFTDYVRTDVGFNTHLSGWSNGDFNASSAVDFDDYVLIDIAFNTQAPTRLRLLGDRLSDAHETIDDALSLVTVVA